LQRTALSVFAALLAAGIIGTALTVLLWDDDEPLATALSPSPTATASPLLLPSPSPSVSPTGSPAASPSPSPSPTPTTATTAPTSAPSGSAPRAVDVNCEQTPQYCTSTSGQMRINDDKLVSSGTTQHPADYSAVPNTTMTWRIVREGGGDARNGDDVSQVEIAVEIRNDTDRTWVIPRREVVLRVFYNGSELHELVTSGPDFEMRPGGVLTARYTIPIHDTGEYSWRGKTSFYAR